LRLALTALFGQSVTSKVFSAWRQYNRKQPFNIGINRQLGKGHPVE